MLTENFAIDVIDRTALIENIINQIIEAFCQPRKEPFMFFWNVILDSSNLAIRVEDARSDGNCARDERKTRPQRNTQRHVAPQRIRAPSIELSPCAGRRENSC